MFTLPIFFYPMRKIILDDNVDFIQSMLLKMSDKHFIPYTSSKEALNYLLCQYNASITKFTFLNDHFLTDSLNHSFLNVDLKKLKKIITFTCSEDINILLIDYHMPEMNGIEFLQKISHLPIKKVLITSEQDYKVGIDAFNKGMVDAYIRKNDTDFQHKIKNIISELEWKYFIELCSPEMAFPNLHYLYNAECVKKFKQILIDNKIKSYHLTHFYGDWTMVNHKSEELYLLIRTKNQLKELANLAKEDGASLDTINKLEKGKAIPFFNGQESWEIPGCDWGRFLYSANVWLDHDVVWTIINN